LKCVNFQAATLRAFKTPLGCKSQLIAASGCYIALVEHYIIHRYSVIVSELRFRLVANKSVAPGHPVSIPRKTYSPIVLPAMLMQQADATPGSVCFAPDNLSYISHRFERLFISRSHTLIINTGGLLNKYKTHAQMCKRSDLI
jgi:hypothetical protein